MPGAENRLSNVQRIWRSLQIRKVLSSVIGIAICLFWQVIAKTLNFPSCIWFYLKWCLFPSFRKSANYGLDFSLSGTSAAEGETVGDQYLCRDPNSFVQKLELKRRKFKANKNKGCFNQATRPLAWQRSHQVQVIFIRQHFNFPL